MTTAPALSTASYQPRWELGTALAYGGALVALVADNWGLYRLGQHHRWAGAFLAVGLFLALLIAARVLTRRGEALAGGLSALLAATALPWFVAAVEQLHSHLHAGGAAAELSPGFLLLSQPHGTSAGWIGADVVALLASLILLARYRFALLAVPAVFAIWFVGQDIAAHGSDRAQGLGAFASGMSPGRSAAAAFVVAAVLIGIGLLFERWGWRREAFWPHLGAGLSVVQALIGLGTTYDPDVVLGVGLGLGAVGLLLAIGIARSSYGVIGGGLVLLATAYFAEKAAHASGLGFPFVVALLALCLAAGGVLLARRAR